MKPASPSRKRPVYRLLAVERLEQRVVLSANSLQWGGDANLTLSFAADGTNIAGMHSSLYATLDRVATSTEWQEAILRAFQTWAVETNASIGVAPDGGQDFGAAGASRGDPRFGDIRVGAAPLAPGTYAIAVSSSDAISGTWVGDVIFNSNAEFANLDEVFAVALHEAGHVFGLEHSDDPLSPMHVHGVTPAASLTSADADAIRALYGAPQPDLNERVSSNDTPNRADQLKVNRAGAGAAGTAPSLVYGGITDIGDVDFYRLPAPAGYLGPVTVTLRTSGISLLAPQLTLFDGDGTRLAQAYSTRFDGDVVSVVLEQMPAKGQLLIEVASGRTDVFAVGGYSLTAIFDDLNAVSAETIVAAASGSLRFLPQNELAKVFAKSGDSDPPYFFDDERGNDHAAAGTRLTTAPGFAPQTRYDTFGSITDAADVDYYRVTAPLNGGSVMTIRLRSVERAGLISQVSVLGRGDEELRAEVLINDGGELVLQVLGVEPRETLTIGVFAETFANQSNTGNYQLTVDFDDAPTTLAPVASGSILPGHPLMATSLYVAEPQLFYFGLEALPAATAPDAIVMVTIRDAGGNIVHRLAARAGETRTAGSVLLKPGEYRLEFAGLTIEPLVAELGFTLLAAVSSDPFAADPDDPTFQPEFQCEDPEHAGLYCYPGEFVSADPYLWSSFLTSVENPPDGVSFQELVRSLLAEWWAWIWQQVGANGPPLARSDTVTLSPSTSLAGGGALTAPISVLANDIEPEGEPVVAWLRSTTSRGLLTLYDDGMFDYLPNDGFEGVDSFTYVAVAGEAPSAETRVRIFVGFRGDYDGTGAVDGADFLSWQRGYGQPVLPTGSGADGDGDGVVTLADGSVWAYMFGATKPATEVIPSYPLSAGAATADVRVAEPPAEAATTESADDSLWSIAAWSTSSQEELLAEDGFALLSRRQAHDLRTTEARQMSLQRRSLVNVSAPYGARQRALQRPVLGNRHAAVDEALGQLVNNALRGISR